MIPQIQEARKEGYSDQEIFDFLSQQKGDRSLKMSEALKEGYQPTEILEFLSPTKEKSVKEHIQRKVGGPLIEAAVKGITAIPNFMDTMAQLGVKGISSLLRKMGVDVSDSDTIKAFQIAKSLGPTAGIPSGEELVEGIHKVTEGKFRPTTESERVLQKGAGIVGGIAGFGPAAALGTPLRAAGTAALGATTATMEESGVNPWVALGGGILADVLTRSLGGAAKKVAGVFAKGIPKSAGEITAQVARVKPEQINQGIVEAAERLGIKKNELPLSAQIDNPILQGIESKIRSSSLSGKSLQKQLETTGEKIKGSYRDIENELSSRQEMLPSVVSQEAVNALRSIEESGEQAYRSFYSQAMKSLPENAVSSPQIGKAIQNIIKSTMSKLKSDLGTPAKDALYKRLERLNENWASHGDHIPIQKIIEAKQDLNQIIKYELKGGVDKLLEPLVGSMRNAIRSYGKDINPQFLNRFNQAEKFFAENARSFRKDPVIRSLVRGESPEQVLNRMNTVKGIRDLERVFGKSDEGKQAINALKRYKLENLIGSKLLNKKGEISWGNASGMFKNPKTRDLAIELVGRENFKKLKDIVSVSSAIEDGLRKFLNTSQTATTHLDIALLVGAPLKAMGYLFSGRPLKAVGTASALFTPKILSDLMSNPEYIEAIKKTALAAKGSNPSKFIEEAKRAAAIVASSFVIPPSLEEVNSRAEQPDKIR